MHVLVTGGLGFLGSSLVRRLSRNGMKVRAFDNSSRGSAERLGDVVKEVEIVEGDIRDPASVDRAMKGVDAVWHLAFVNGTEFFYKHPAYVLDVGVKGMVNVLDAAIRNGVKEMFLASSSEVYQTPPSVPTDESVPLLVPDPREPRYSYGGGKIISELMALNYGREYFERVVIFRPHNVYGPQMGYEHVIPQFVRRMADLSGGEKKRPLPFPIQGDGSQTRSFIYIEDFTAGLLLLKEKGKHLEIYHLGTTEEISIRTLVEKVAAQMDLPVTIVTGDAPAGATPRRCPDIGKMQALGFAPRHSLDAGLAPTVLWYREHPPAATRAHSAPTLFL